MLLHRRSAHQKRTIAETIEFLPHTFTMPATSSADLAIQAVQELTEALKKPQPAAPFLEPLHRHNKALQEFADIFKTTVSPPCHIPGRRSEDHA